MDSSAPFEPINERFEVLAFDENASAESDGRQGTLADPAPDCPVAYAHHGRDLCYVEQQGLRSHGHWLSFHGLPKRLDRARVPDNGR